MAEKDRAVRVEQKGKGFEVPDNKQDGEVRTIDTMSQDEDISRIRPYTSGSKGYPSEAWNYKY
jgi:hypothetical protein